MKNLLLASILLLCCSFTSHAAAAVAEKDWGLAAGFRIAKIPYPTTEESVEDFIPLIFYDGDTFFIRGLDGGIKLYNQKKWQFSLLARYRYFDIPAKYQNIIRGNSLDLGGQVKYRFTENFASNVELMSDNDHRFYSTIDARYYWQSGSWDINPYAVLRVKSAEFNNYYYGLDDFTVPGNQVNSISNKIGSGVDLTIGSEIRYHVISNLYLLGRVQLTTLDQKTKNAASIHNATFGEVYLGIAFFNDKTKKKTRSLKAKPYLRLAHGYATPSDLSDILAFNWEDDPQNNQMTSIFYGHPVSDTLFGVDAFDVYITTGYARHLASASYKQTLVPGTGVNSPDFAGLDSTPCKGTDPCTITYDAQPVNEYVLGVKVFYNFNWPVHWRIGLAEGLSYVDCTINIEQREMDQKGYQPSKLMNYVDASIDFSLGDAFGVQAINDLYFGVGIHHRSSIFEKSSSFGRIKGGSNYNSAYLQYHF